VARYGKWKREEDDEDLDEIDLEVPKIRGIGALESFHLRRMKLVQVHLSYLLTLLKRLNTWKKQKENSLFMLAQDLRRKGIQDEEVGEAVWI